MGMVPDPKNGQTNISQKFESMFKQPWDSGSIKQLDKFQATFFPKTSHRGLGWFLFHEIGGRDSPHGVFDPWARWDLGLVRLKSFRVVIVVVVAVTADISSNKCTK